jgi:hypothetical protein
MKYLRTLQMYDTNCKDIPDLNKFIHLQIVDLSTNQMKSHLPSLSRLKQLRELSIANTKIQFKASTFDSLINLEQINFDDVNFERNIYELDQSLNSAIFLPSFHGCIKLKSIDFQNNSFSGTFPDTWKQLTNLETFKINKEIFILNSIPNWLQIETNTDAGTGTASGSTSGKQLYWKGTTNKFPYILSTDDNLGTVRLISSTAANNVDVENLNPSSSGDYDPVSK